MMRHFTQQQRAPGLRRHEASDIHILETDCYTEFEFTLDDGSFGVVYVLPCSENIFLICTCMPDDIAAVLEAYSTMSPQVQPMVLRSFQETWPRMTELLIDGRSEVFSNGALTVVEDPDNLRPRWVIATVAGNVRCQLGSPILRNRRLLESMYLVNQTSQAVTKEFTSRALDLDRLSSRIGWQNFRANFKSLGRFVDDHFDSVLGFLESLSAD